MDHATPQPPYDESHLRALYQDSLGGAGEPMAPAMALALQASFGGEARWREAFAASAEALGGGPGWVLLSFQPREGTLVHQSLPDPAQAIAGAIPILALDMAEPADHGVHGAAPGSSVDAFMAAIDWAKVYARYQVAVEHASAGLAASAEDLAQALVLDVRRAGVYQQAATRIPGATWRDPGAVGEWGGSLPAGQPVVVYCVYGHEVGRATALRLHAAGIQARFLLGGIDGWAQAGRPLHPKEDAS